jgi:hypothetical protein
MPPKLRRRKSAVLDADQPERCAIPGPRRPDDKRDTLPLDPAIGAILEQERWDANRAREIRHIHERCNVPLSRRRRPLIFDPHKEASWWDPKDLGPLSILAIGILFIAVLYLLLLASTAAECASIDRIGVRANFTKTIPAVHQFKESTTGMHTAYEKFESALESDPAITVCQTVVPLPEVYSNLQSELKSTASPYSTTAFGRLTSMLSTWSSAALFAAERHRAGTAAVDDLKEDLSNLQSRRSKYFSPLFSSNPTTTALLSWPQHQHVVTVTLLPLVRAAVKEVGTLASEIHTFEDTIPQKLTYVLMRQVTPVWDSVRFSRKLEDVRYRVVPAFMASHLPWYQRRQEDAAIERRQGEDLKACAVALTRLNEARATESLRDLLESLFALEVFLERAVPFAGMLACDDSRRRNFIASIGGMGTTSMSKDVEMWSQIRDELTSLDVSYNAVKKQSEAPASDGNTTTVIVNLVDEVVVGGVLS